AIRFHPYAVVPLLRIAGSALVPQELIVPRLARWAGLCERASFERVLEGAVAALRALIRDARDLDPLAAAACRELGSPEDARIAALARRLEVSPRTLE